MAVSLDVTLDAIRQAARIIVGGFPAGADTFTVTRTSPSGQTVAVRGYVGAAVPEGGASAALRDYEVPFGVDLDYDVTAYGTVTNLVPNGGFETNLTGVSTWGPGVTATRDTAAAKYGAASLRVTTPGTNAYEGVRVATAALALAQPHVASVWIRGQAGKLYRVQVFNAAASAQLAFTDFTASGDWQRVVLPFTSHATDALHSIFLQVSGTFASTYHADGVQVQTGSIASDYIETDGAPASGPGIVGMAEDTFRIAYADCEAWLVDLARPTNSLPLLIESMNELEFDAAAGVHRILNRRAPVLTTLPAWTPSSELIVLTETLAERDQVRALLGSGYPFLLRTDPAQGVGNMYLGVTDFVEERFLTLGAAAQRRFRSACVQVERPDPAIYVPAPPSDYGEVKAAYATYGDLLAGAVTYDGVLYGAPSEADPVVPWLPDDV